MTRGLLDTSVLIAAGQGVPQTLPDEAAISIMTLAELRVGVLVTDDPGVRAQRLDVLSGVERELTPIPVDDAVAARFARIVAVARREGRRPRVADTLIAATAAAHDLTLYTRDQDFAGLPGVTVSC